MVYNFYYYINRFYQDYPVDKTTFPEKVSGNYYFINITNKGKNVRMYVYSSNEELSSFMEKRYCYPLSILYSIEHNKKTLIPFTKEIVTFLEEKNIKINYNQPFGLLF